MDQLKVAGELLALKLLVAKALAVAVREHEDPRGALAEVINAIESDVGDSLANMHVEGAEHAIEKIGGAARESILYVGGIADNLLRHMGAPPATD